ncbi:hypothetical protein SAZ_38040 [Streptomyces noursei ZPM]|nr:hypothetical protein SAZ_38040 [Streptomyces noursei ZPM]
MPAWWRPWNGTRSGGSVRPSEARSGAGPRGGGEGPAAEEGERQHRGGRAPLQQHERGQAQERDDERAEDDGRRSARGPGLDATGGQRGHAHRRGGLGRDVEAAAGRSGGGARYLT